MPAGAGRLGTIAFGNTPFQHAARSHQPSHRRAMPASKLNGCDEG
jgi:hypothetical protein